MADRKRRTKPSVPKARARRSTVKKKAKARGAALAAKKGKPASTDARHDAPTRTPTFPRMGARGYLFHVGGRVMEGIEGTARGEWWKGERAARFEIYRKAIERGHAAGLFAAIEDCLDKRPFCEELLLDVPWWVLFEARETLLDLAKGERSPFNRGRKGGRNARWIHRHNEDWKDLCRFSSYVKALEEGNKKRRLYARALELLEAGAPWAARGKKGSMTPAGLKRSCARFERNRKSDPLRYIGMNILLDENEPKV